MKTHYRLIVLALLVLSLLGSALAFRRSPRDGSTIPVLLVSEVYLLTDGNQTNMLVTMNQDTTSDTVVNLSSNNSGLSVPSTVTVPSGHYQASFTVTANSGGSGDATVTASCNGGQAQTTVDLTSR